MLKPMGSVILPIEVKPMSVIMLFLRKALSLPVKYIPVEALLDPPFTLVIEL